MGCVRYLYPLLWSDHLREGQAYHCLHLRCGLDISDRSSHHLLATTALPIGGTGAALVLITIFDWIDVTLWQAMAQPYC